MEKDILSNNWNKALLYIKSRIEDTAFQTLFDGLEISRIEDDTITLLVPNRFHYEWIESKYRHLIHDALKDAFGKSFVVNYSVLLTEKSGEEIPQFKKRENSIIPKSYNRSSNLNNRYNFENFIEGKDNQFARAAAISVTDKPGQTPFNPLLIYSSPGLGKTHLIQAAGNRMARKNKSFKVLYITGEKFMLDFISSIQKNKSSEFTKFYRNTDMLLLDDVHFLEGKEQTQEQFFHLFNDLYQRGKQIILTTDRHPRNLVGLKERLVSRFQSGLIADIQPPDLETRIAIIRNDAKHNGLELDYSITEFIANTIKQDVRIMKSILIRLQALSALKNIDISMDLCREVIAENFGHETMQKITLKQILNYVCEKQEVNKKKVLGKGRSQEIALARQVVMYLCRELTSLSLKKIGAELGKRDHSTVIHACKIIEEKINSKVAFNKTINQYKEDLNKFKL